MRGPARLTSKLYLLGDIFDEWLGDDDPRKFHKTILIELKALVDSGTKTYLLTGNHDFLIGSQFQLQSGVKLLPEPVNIVINEKQILLLHGDSLCTLDLEYQKWRNYFTNKRNQQKFLNYPFWMRYLYAVWVRRFASGRKKLKPDDIMDVELSSVIKIMLQTEIFFMIHGHTHRPAVHQFACNNKSATRIVLGDWYENSSILCVKEYGDDFKTDHTSQDLEFIFGDLTQLKNTLR